MYLSKTEEASGRKCRYPPSSLTDTSNSGAWGGSGPADGGESIALTLRTLSGIDPEKHTQSRVMIMTSHANSDGDLNRDNSHEWEPRLYPAFAHCNTAKPGLSVK
jgi:hypothetical protein